MMSFPLAIAFGEVIISWRTQHSPTNDIGINLVIMSAEGRVEPQKSTKR